jgi:hypothetical protein
LLESTQANYLNTNSTIKLGETVVEQISQTNANINKKINKRKMGKQINE